MSNLQLSSLKIAKEPKKESKDSMTFMCGGCPKRYKSYPALYLHIKRKHQGVRPPNTKIAKPSQPTFVANAQTGRPSKVESSLCTLLKTHSPYIMWTTCRRLSSLWRRPRTNCWAFWERS